MNRKLLLGIVMSVFLVASVMAGGKAIGFNNENSNIHNLNTLELYEKNPSDWTIVEDGANGLLSYKTGVFDFDGYGLEAEEDYTLIYYPDPWPGNGLLCLGIGMTDDEGTIEIKGTFNFNKIPIEGDENDGAKIWLILSSDVDCDAKAMTGWNPTEYLFEYDLI